MTSQHGWVSDNQGRPLFYSGGGIPIYRLYNHQLRGLHHWTTDQNEYTVLPGHGWKQEGTSFYAVKIGQPIQTQYAQKILYNGVYNQVRGKYGYIPIVNKKYGVSPSYNPGEDLTAKAAFNSLTNQMRALVFGIWYLVFLTPIVVSGVIVCKLLYIGTMLTSLDNPQRIVSQLGLLIVNISLVLLLMCLILWRIAGATNRSFLASQ